MTKRMVAVLGAALCLWAMPGCDSGDDYEDHRPPPGQGSLIIDNHTADDVAVFLDGNLIGLIDSDSYRIFDLIPGLHRLVVAEAGEGDRSYRDDVDILENRLTIVDVWSGATYAEYDATVRFR